MHDVSFYLSSDFHLSKWNHYSAVFRMIAREYRQVVAARLNFDYHRSVVIQTVSELLDLRAVLETRRPVDSPITSCSDQTEHEWLEAVWLAAVDWVLQLRSTWNLCDSKSGFMSAESVELAHDSNTMAERKFLAAVGDDSAETARPHLLHVQTR